MVIQPKSESGKSAVMSYNRLYAKFHKRIDNLRFLNKTGLDFDNADVGINYNILKPLPIDLINISISRSINSISQSASISDIYYDEFFELFTKYDRVIVYVLDENNEEQEIFNGEIINKNESYSLDGGETFSFELLDNLNLLNRVNVPYISEGKNIQNYIENSFVNAGLLPASPQNLKAVALTGLNTYIPIVFQLDNPNKAHFEASGNFMNYLSEIRKNYPFYLFGDRLSRLNVSLPEFLFRNQLEVWEIDLNTSSAYIDIDNVFNMVNLMITIGFSDEEDKSLEFGWAFDSISYAMNGGKISYRIEYAFDVFGYDELSKLASNKLIKENKNFKVKINNLPFFHGYDVGQFIKIKNHRTIDSNQIFFIEDLKHDLSVDGFSTEITASAFSLGIIPEDFVEGQQVLDPLKNIKLGETFRKRD